MRKTIYLLFLFCVFPFSVQAQDFIAAPLKLEELNRLKPLQNPVMKLGKDVLDRGITDSRNRVVGDIEDLVFDEQGVIELLLVNFGRLHLRESVYLNYANLDIESLADGYKMPFTEEKIEEFYPEVLQFQDTITAQLTDKSSYQELIGRDVMTQSGEKIATLDEILLDKDARVVRGMYLNVNHKITRNVGVAVPFEALKLETENAQTRLIIAPEWAEAALTYAKSQ